MPTKLLSDFAILGPRVIARTLAPPEKTEGGVLIPGAAQRQLNQAVILAAGHTEHPMPLDSVIVFAPYGVVPMPMLGEGVILLHEDDIFMVSLPERSTHGNTSAATGSSQ